MPTGTNLNNTHAQRKIWSVLKFVHIMCISIFVSRTEQFFSIYRFTYARMTSGQYPARRLTPSAFASPAVSTIEGGTKQYHMITSRHSPRSVIIIICQLSVLLASKFVRSYEVASTHACLRIQDKLFSLIVNGGKRLK
jgi:hypothetical protein